MLHGMPDVACLAAGAAVSEPAAQAPPLCACEAHPPLDGHLPAYTQVLMDARCWHRGTKGDGRDVLPRGLMLVFVLPRPRHVEVTDVRTAAALWRRAVFPTLVHSLRERVHSMSDAMEELAGFFLPASTPQDQEDAMGAAAEWADGEGNEELATTLRQLQAGVEQVDTDAVTSAAAAVCITQRLLLDDAGKAIVYGDAGGLEMLRLVKPDHLDAAACHSAWVAQATAQRSPFPRAHAWLQ